MFKKRLIAPLAVVGIASAMIGVAPVSAKGAGGGTQPPPGTSDGYVTDCVHGAYFLDSLREKTGALVPPPTVAKSMGCIAVNFGAGETILNGSVTIKLPAGIQLTRKIAAPTGTLAFGDGRCTWTGKFALASSGGAQTLRLDGVSCASDGMTLAAFFAATIGNPTDVSYIAFNDANRTYVKDTITAGAPPFLTCFSRFVGNPATLVSRVPFAFGAAYTFTGSYTTIKGGAAIALANANASEKGLFLIAPDAEFFDWWTWYLATDPCLPPRPPCYEGGDIGIPDLKIDVMPVGTTVGAWSARDSYDGSCSGVSLASGRAFLAADSSTAEGLCGGRGLEAAELFPTAPANLYLCNDPKPPPV
jgi:hypothetical protein